MYVIGERGCLPQHENDWTRRSKGEVAMWIILQKPYKEALISITNT